MEHTGEADGKRFHFEVSWDGIKRVMAYAVASALMTIGLAFGIAAVVHDQTEADTKAAVLVVVQRVDDTQRLICGILKNADNPDIRQAVERYCPPEGP